MLKQSLFFKQAETIVRVNPARWQFYLVLMLTFMMCAFVQTVNAQSQSRLLDAPRAAGIVGERYDGFAVVRGTASPEISTLVDQVNAERRAVYAQSAAKDRVPIEAVGKIYATQIIKSAPSGTWFLSEDGKWTRK